MKVKYTVYQLPFSENIDENTLKLKYMSYEYTENHGGVHIENYKKVYTGNIDTDTLDTDIILDEVYTICNLDIPEGYEGHAMSVSDIVEIENLGTYFCDSIGWKRIA